MDSEQNEAAPGTLFDVEQQIEEAIKAYDEESGGENALLLGWVVVAEWVDQDGDPNLTAFARERMPYWRINALLEAGRMEVLYDDDEYFLDDDD